MYPKEPEFLYKAADWEEVGWGLGRGDDKDLNDDKEPSNKEIYKKDKEQGQDDLAKIH
jgi:hypothetical protein